MNLRRSVRRHARRHTRRLGRATARLVAVSASMAVALPLAAGAAQAAPPATTVTPAASALAAAPGSVDDGVLRILLFYKDNFHASNVQARQAIRDLAADLGTQYGQPVDIEETSDPAAFTPANLATKDTLAFMQTGGVLFNETQRAALEDYMTNGGGFLGNHYTGWSVGQSEHDVNPFYAKLVGAVSEGHPEAPAVRPGRVEVKDVDHPLNAGVPATFTRSDEWYDWVANPAPLVRTLAVADESSYGMGEQGSTHPITWCQPIEQGRSWYSGMGHEGSAYSEAPIRAQMRNGLAYTAGLLPADCSPPQKDDQGAWSGVTPWPLVPINMSLTSEGKVQSFGSVSTGCKDPNPYDFSGNSCIWQGGQFETDVWDPDEERTAETVTDGIVTNSTYTDLFCSIQVHNAFKRTTMTVGGDDSQGDNAPNDGAIGVTSYNTRQGLRNEAPMRYPRWYPTATTMPSGDILVQGGSLTGGPGGAGVKTPELYTPDEGSGWRELTGATSSVAYGDGGADHAGQDENRWWYPRAWVAPGSGTLFNITGTQMYEVDPDGNGGTGELTLRGTLPAGIANQGGLGNPVGATSTATMYRPGKILQVGGGWWANGGGPAGARAGFTVDVTGGTANPVVAATQPMTFQRHWASSTVMPDGNVIVTGGSRDNNGNGGYVTNPEIWNPDTGEWTVVQLPYARARLYHSSALLLPDGRVMIGGGGAPGPRNYTDVEYYSPTYLFDGDEPAVRPELTGVPTTVGYDGSFDVQSDSQISRVTLVRNGSVTHGFNNDQNFQDLEFTQTGGTLRIETPVDGTYAPPGPYMLFAFNEDGTPAVADIVNIDPTKKMAQRAPLVVDQFEYPRTPAQWPTQPPMVADVAAGSGRMSPWEVTSPVQLVRGVAPSQGGLGGTGYHLGLGSSGALQRTLKGLDVGREYRISLRFARDSRSAGTDPATAQVSIGDLDATITATTANPSQSDTVTFGTFVDTFVASGRSAVLDLTATSAAGVMIDNLVITPNAAGAADPDVRYAFDEGAGTTAANTGSDVSVGDAVLTGSTGWSESGIDGAALDLRGGANANTVDLPDNLLQGEVDFSTSFWVRPDTKGNWINLFHVGDGLEGAGSFFQIQMQTQDGGQTGLAATFKKKGSAVQERVYATPVQDVTVNQWNHVAFTRQGATGSLYLNGVKIASRDDLTITMADVGPTTNNWLGRNGYPDPAFDGLMDDVRLYTSALSDADVAGMYADGSALTTTTTVSTSPASPTPFGEPVTVTATVAAAAGPAPSGVAELWIDGVREGVQVDVAAGAVTFPAVTLAPRVHDVEVRFLADDGWRDSATTVQHTVSRPPVGDGVPVRYTFDEGVGTSAANSGSDPSIGSATLQGNAGWTPAAQLGGGLNLPGAGHVNLPNDITEGMDEEITISTWIRPTALPNWTTHVQIGKGTQEFLLLQSSTDNGNRGFAATLRVNEGEQYRVWLDGETDLPLNQWTHVAVTYGPSPTGTGTTGRVYFNGVLQAGGERHNMPVNIGDVGEGGTNANFIGNTSWPDPRPTEQVDDFRIYGYELSAAEVVELFEGEANEAPVGVGDTYTTSQDEALTIAAPGVLANDTDTEGDDLTATSVTQPAGGVVDVEADGSFTYVPDDGFVGDDTFTYRADDGTSASTATTVTIAVQAKEVPPNVAPVSVDDAFSTVAGEPLALAAPGVLGNDTDADGDALTATRTSQPVNGSVTVNANGSFTYTPDAGFAGRDVFTYTAGDGSDTSAPATVTITVRPTGGNGGGPLTSAVAGASTPITYGQAGTIVASVAPSGATGRVEAVDGTTVLASGVLASGQARLALPARSLLPGTHRLTLRYVGDDGHRASSSSMEVTVDKVVPRMTVKAPSTVRKGKAAKVTVVLTAADDVPVTGTVSVAVRGGRTLTGTLRDGRVVIRLPKATRTWRLTVTYGGSGLAEPVSDKVTIKVRRKK